MTGSNQHQELPVVLPGVIAAGTATIREFACPNWPHPGITGCEYCARAEERGVFEALRQITTEVEFQLGRSRGLIEQLEAQGAALEYLLDIAERMRDDRVVAPEAWYLARDGARAALAASSPADEPLNGVERARAYLESGDLEGLRAWLASSPASSHLQDAIDQHNAGNYERRMAFRPAISPKESD